MSPSGAPGRTAKSPAEDTAATLGGPGGDQAGTPDGPGPLETSSGPCEDRSETTAGPVVGRAYVSGGPVPGSAGPEPVSTALGAGASQAPPRRGASRPSGAASGPPCGPRTSRLPAQRPPESPGQTERQRSLFYGVKTSSCLASPRVPHHPVFPVRWGGDARRELVSAWRVRGRECGRGPRTRRADSCKEARLRRRARWQK